MQRATKYLRAVQPKPAPIGGLSDKRFVYVKHADHTLDGFRARMEQYRAEMALKGK